jgi:hypothetical protein
MRLIQRFRTTCQLPPCQQSAWQTRIGPHSATTWINPACRSADSDRDGQTRTQIGSNDSDRDSDRKGQTPSRVNAMNRQLSHAWDAIMAANGQSPRRPDGYNATAKWAGVGLGYDGHIASRRGEKRTAVAGRIQSSGRLA